MAYTGTTNLLVAASDVYTEALSICGVYDPFVQIQPSDQTTCIFSLNLLCKALVQAGLPLWAVQDVSVPMVQGSASYYIGPSANSAASTAAGGGSVSTGAAVTGITLTNAGSSGTATFNWSNSTLPFTGTYNVFGFTSNAIVAIAGGTTSPATAYSLNNGLTWTLGGTISASTGIVSLLYNGTTLVALEGYGQDTWTSTNNGVTWTHNVGVLPAFFGGTMYGNVAASSCYGNGLFVTMAAYSGSMSIATSSNGVSWTSQTPPTNKIYCASITYANGAFVAVGQMAGLSAVNYYLYSTNGINWYNASLPVSATWGGISYNGSTWLIIVNGSTISYTSPNAATASPTWTAQTLPASNSWNSIEVNNSGVFAIGCSTNNNIWLSSTGTTGSWTSSTYSGVGTGTNMIDTDGTNFYITTYTSTNNFSYSSNTYPSAGTYPLVFSSTSGIGAAGTYTISATTGTITSTSLTAGGSGYLTSPTILFNYGGITGAAATAVLGSNGQSYSGINGTYGYQITNSRPLRILSAYIRDVNGNDTILSCESRYEYNTNGAKTTQSTPNQLYYDPQLTNGLITVFGVPPDATTTIHLVVQRQIFDINFATDNPDFPQDAYLMLSWGLADIIAMKYRVKPQDRAEIAMKAKMFKDEFFSFQQDYVPIQIVPGDDFSLESMGTSF